MRAVAPQRLVPGGHVSLRFADDDTLARALTALGRGFVDPGDDERLTVQVPSDGGVAALRELLGSLDAAGMVILVGVALPAGSMPSGLRWFAEYQPFTPIMETVRGLLLGTPIGDSAALAVAWCAAIAVPSYLWAKHTYGKA